MQKTFRRHIRQVVFSVLCVAFTASTILSAQDKRPLGHTDYDGWKSIIRPLLSPDGRWLLYLETPQDGDACLVVKDLESTLEHRHSIGYSGEGTDAEKEAKPQFSRDSKHVAFLISPSMTQAKEAKKSKDKKAKDKLKKALGIMNMSSGEVSVVDRVKSFQLPEEAGGWVAYLKEEPAKDEEKDKEVEKEEEEKEASEKKEEKKDDADKKKITYGTDLVVRSLSDGIETVIPSATEFIWLKNGNRLFYAVRSEETPANDGAYAIRPGDAAGSALVAGEGDYKKLTLNEDETHLAFLSSRDDQTSDEPTFRLYGCKTSDAAASLWVSHTSTQGFPEGMAVSDKSDLAFSDDGQVILFGIKEIPEPKTDADSTNTEKEAKFDLWHWNDPYPQPQQKMMAEKVRDNTWESVWFLKSNRFVRLADETLPDLSLNRFGKIAFGQTNWPHSKKVSYFGQFNDVYVVDPTNGKKTLVKEELFGYSGAAMSPHGKYVFWFEGTDWFVYDARKGVTANVTKGLHVCFDREDHDRPEPPSPYGIAGWTTDDQSVLIYDRYDIWSISPDGKIRRMITEGYGREHDLSFRYVKLDPDEIAIDPDAALLLSATHQETMDEGFYRDRVTGNALPVQLIEAERAFGRPIKAKDADLLVFTRFTFDEYPDLWVSDLAFSNVRKVTDLGGQMDPFFWGKAEMRDFASADGKPLKGILVKPEGFDPTRQYPLMVYIYETLHNNRHRYRHPSPGTSINPPYYVSNGYVLWMPDIEYDTGYPGQDALKCVLPGIQMLVREGFIDREAIGIQGHSWGGYQIAYMVTQTNIFKAVESGAPVSNMTSAYGGIRWASGMVRQFQYEQTQSRLGASLWEVPMRYIENSPIFWADKVKTPVLMIHNDADGAVPWYQGIEYMMALRRLGKPAWMFNYNGEAHGLRKRVNQKDFTIRMAEFFDHYLKSAPEPEWMTNGIQAWEKEEEIKEE